MSHGACDWGLTDANIIASCEVCAQYYDPRPAHKNNNDRACVYVPGKSLCYPAATARKKNWIMEEASDCGMPIKYSNSIS